MTLLISELHKRKALLVKLVFLFASFALLFNLFFTITPPMYFEGKYNLDFVHALIVYKILELTLLYYLLLHRHIVFLRDNNSHIERMQKLRKQSKLFLFLIIQGNTVFGIIAFKFSGNILYFLLFSCIAFFTFYILEPKKLFKHL